MDPAVARGSKRRDVKRARDLSRTLFTSGARRQPALNIHQVQVITPLVIAQVFADCECVAVALHDGGGPATAVTMTVTFCEGEKPWSGAADVAVPEK
jgi:hypothetical protein